MARVSIKEIEYFVNVTKEGSVSAAAATLSVSQPAVGVQIKQLEEKLKTILFLRHSRGVSLTETGNLYLIYAQEILEKIDEAHSTVSNANNFPNISLRLGVTPSLSRMILPQLLHHVAGLQPQLKIVPFEALSKTLLQRHCQVVERY